MSVIDTINQWGRKPSPQAASVQPPNPTPKPITSDGQSPASPARSRGDAIRDSRSGEPRPFGRK